MGARIVVVGGGFAGVGVADRLERRCPDADVRLVSPDDFLLYLPLLPQVAAGVLSPRSVAVSLTHRLRRTTVVPGRAVGVDAAARRVVVETIAGGRRVLDYDRLVLAPGSVTRVRDIPGLAERGRGMKTLAEATYLRDHVLAQLELAAMTDDPDERARRCRFVVVGGGYAGVETAANLQRTTARALRGYRRLDPSLVSWHVVQHGDRLLPELGERLGRDTRRMLTGCGVHVELGTGLERVDPLPADGGRDPGSALTLSDGRRLETATLVWTAGVAPNPLMDRLGMETDHGRLVVGPDLAVPGHPEVLALGDAAAVPDLASGGDAPCPPTAQHATRQAPVAADNVAAGLAGRATRAYRHHDMGLVVDLGGRDAVATPVGLPLSGLPAQVVTRGYHLWAMREPEAMARVLGHWGLHAVGGGTPVRLGFLTDSTGRLAAFEHTDDYLTPEQARAAAGAR